MSAAPVLDPVDDVLGRLQKVKRSGKGWTACCPAHDDNRASLTVGRGEGGRVLLRCQRGCETSSVLEAIGLQYRDLFPDEPEQRPVGRPEIIGTYDYTDEAGRLLYQAVRYFPKDFRQRRPDPQQPGRWIWNLADTRRVPYRLRDLPDAIKAGKFIFVCEGEKDADRLVSLGFRATCNAMGAGKWTLELSHHFKGARVVILPDNDDPGRDHARSVAEQLGGIATEVRIVPLPGLAPKGDVSDWLDAGHTADELKELVRQAPPGLVPDLSADSTATEEPAASRTEPPRPLSRPLPPADPFPVDALGPVLAPAARAIHDHTQAPLAICGQSVLAVAALSVQGHADVELPMGQAKPTGCFFVTVAGSGERKSAADSLALDPVKRREAELGEAHELEVPRSLNERDVWKKERDRVLNDKKKSAAVKREELAALGPEPEGPPTPILTCPEPTFEGLCKMLAAGHPSVGVFSGEGGQFIGGHGMNQDNRLRTAAGLSSIWDGDPIKRVRSGDGTVVLGGRRLSMHLMVQPGVAAGMLSDPLLLDQGLLSRTLVTAPDSTAGSRSWREPSSDAGAALAAYSSHLYRVLRAPLPRSERKAGELRPRRLPLSREARQAWVAFHDHVEAQLGPGKALEPIRGFGNKLAEHAARLAAVLELVQDLQCEEVSGDAMASGIDLAQHYAAEALRLFEAGRMDPALQLAERLLRWLHESWAEPLVSLPDIYQRGLNAISDARTARQFVNILEEHGWLARRDRPAEVGGVMRREVWLIRRGE